jgi:hypothetical protein
MNDATSPASARDHLRAAALAAHVVAITLLALPQPAVSEQDLATDGVTAWFSRAAELLGGVGVAATGDDVARVAVPLARQYDAARRALTRVPATYARVVGAGQSWRMFSEVRADSAALRIEVRRPGARRPVVVFQQGRAQGLDRGWLGHERMRAQINLFKAKKARAEYDRFLRLLAPRLGVRFPDAVAFRVSMVPVSWPGPERLAAEGITEGEPYWVVSWRAGDTPGARANRGAPP